MSHQLPELGYAYDSLEPHIDARTMEIHHTKHHNAYVAGLNAAIDGNEELQGLSVEELIKNLDKVPADILTLFATTAVGTSTTAFFGKLSLLEALPLLLATSLPLSIAILAHLTT